MSKLSLAVEKSAASAMTGPGDVRDQHWLDAQIDAIETGVEAVVNIARNWTQGRNLARLHPGVSAAEYVTSRVGTLGKAVVPVLLAESNWSNRQIAAVAGISRNTVNELAREVPVDRLPETLGADNKVRTYAPRVVHAVVIDTPPEGEGALDSPATSQPPERTRARLVADAHRDRLTRGLAMVEGACAELANVNFAALTSVATPADLAGWTRQIAVISSAIRTIRRSINGRDDS